MDWEWAAVHLEKESVPTFVVVVLSSGDAARRDSGDDAAVGGGAGMLHAAFAICRGGIKLTTMFILSSLWRCWGGQ